MYIGWTLLQLGIAIAGGSAWTLTTLPAVIASIHREILHEERVLSEKFGDEYDRYRATVPRYCHLSRR
jgi:protein-S-isoprenylcysteine O-methyltransferase Ste14